MPLWQPTAALSRPLYYDRQQSAIAQAFSVFAGAHGSTVRQSYTVPANRAAFIEALWAIILRTGAPTSADFFTETFSYTPNGGGTITIEQMAGFTAATAVVGPLSLTSFGYMASGDLLQVVTEDDSIGGSAIYRGSWKGIEFTK